MSIEQRIGIEGTTMFAQPSHEEGRVAVIDVGSNSVRLVIYDALSRAPAPVFNEKVLCGLGRGLAVGGRLDTDAMAHATATIGRFAALARAQPLAALDAVATAAVRDAENGTAFADMVREKCGIELRIISGAQEARLSALGVAAACPGANGFMGDLGGGSLELVALEDGEISTGATLPLGTFRLQEMAAASGKGASVLIEEALDEQPWIEARPDADLYIVGGAWRALGRMHMERTDYPLHVLHGYTLAAEEMAPLAHLIAKLSPESLRRVIGLARERRGTVPIGALVLVSLLKRLRPRRLVFSAYGLREGLLFNLLPAETRNEDPLFVGCHAMADRAARFPSHANELLSWTAPLFPGETPAAHRLRYAASWLSDIGWNMHPDYRATHAFDHVLHAPLVGLDHAERIELALTIHARYTGRSGGDGLAPLRALISEGAVQDARRRGLALRLAHTLSGGVPGLLDQTGLRLGSKRLTLWTSAQKQELLGDIVLRRLERLASAFDLKPHVESA